MEPSSGLFGFLCSICRYINVNVYFAVADLHHCARIRFRNLCRFASGFEIASSFVYRMSWHKVAGVLLHFFILNYSIDARNFESKTQGHNYPWSLFEVILFNFLYTGAVLVRGSSYGGKGVLWWDKAFFPQSNQVLRLRLWRGRCVSCDLLF
jgi:hypothetical protein